MKTVFVTIFQGVEAKNILRTDIMPTLLDGNIRVVLFTKNNERAELYKKEFNDPRLIYEVVNIQRPKGLNRVMSKLKFSMIRTDTTALKKKIAYLKGGNFFYYQVSAAVNYLFARPSVRKLARMLDYMLVRTDVYGKYFDEYRPGAVFLAHMFDESEMDLLREAKKRGVKTIGLINSWDKLTARCMLRLLPDIAVVFNDINKSEIIGHHDMPENRVFVSGLPQYDHYVSGKFSSKEEFYSRLKIAPDKKLIVFAPAGQDCSDSDWKIIDFLEDLKNKGKFGKNAELLVRFQPNDPLEKQKNEFEARPWLRYDYPGIRFALKKGIDWDMSFADLKHLNDTMKYMSLLICYGSSITIDAAFVNKPVIHINFEIDPAAPFWRRPTTFYGMDHSKRAFRGDAAKKANSPEELVRFVNRYLNNPELDKEERKLLAADQCKFFDGRSGERIGKLILNGINN